jgi:TolA-binding protein
MTRLALAAVLLLLSCARVQAQEWTPPGEPAGERARADDAPPDTSAASMGEGVPLEQYMTALTERRLIAAETGSVEALRRLVREGEELFLEQRYDEASTVLFEVVESPRFADFVDVDEFRAAQFMLARSLEQLGALRTASRYLEQILARGPEELYFGPAFRKLVDVGLRSGNLREQIERAEALEVRELPEDSLNELFYLRGREAYDRQDWAAAEDELSQITRRSRFYASAQYLRGVAAARQREWQTAENHFCTIATTGDRDRFTFFVDDRYFEVKDLARLALGRVAHEQGRADDAFYYYFQVPQDSERIAEALFEAAYAMYEGGDYETAVDLLDQLETRHPESPFADEATLLRGYVHLGRCEFEEANQLFVRFGRVFGPIRREVSDILRNPARQQRLYQDLLVAEARAAESRRRGEESRLDEDDAPRGDATRRLLLAMLEVDPEFYRLHSDVRTLDAEAGRAGRLGTELAEIAARVTGRERPRAAAAELDEVWDESADLRRDIEDARAILGALTEQLDAMRRAQAPADQLRELEQATRQIGTRLAELEAQLDEAVGEVAAAGGRGSTDNTEIAQMLRRDVRNARRLPARIAATRARMVEAGNGAALHAVRRLDRRIGAGLRRARIGRIDAIMGSKRRIEIQIESLAAGRFPPELQDPLRVQGLLRDDEEYWPFEGELWEDEFDETDPVEEVIDEELDELEEAE